MSQANLELAQRSLAAFSEGDLETVLADLAADVEFNPSGRFMDTQTTYRGRDGFTVFFYAFRAAWEEIRVSVERVEDLGDRVLSLGHFHGRGSGSGAAITAEGAWLHTIKGGEIVHIRSFATWNEAFDEVGITE
jgi:ketosteroid isomerase-like protein